MKSLVGEARKIVDQLHRQPRERTVMPPYSQIKIFDAILEERCRQDQKWGPQRDHHPLYWLGILMEEVGETAQTVIEADPANRLHSAETRRELIQVAAVAVCWLEAMDA